MVSPTCLFMKLIIYFAVLCIFVRISSTEPLLNSDDDEDQTQTYDPLFNNMMVGSGRLISDNPHRLDIPESLYDYHQQQLFHQNKQYNPDNQQLVKRIIMLPRVGRRSIRSSSRK